MQLLEGIEVLEWVRGREQPVSFQYANVRQSMTGAGCTMDARDTMDTRNLIGIGVSTSERGIASAQEMIGTTGTTIARDIMGTRDMTTARDMMDGWGMKGVKDVMSGRRRTGTRGARVQQNILHLFFFSHFVVIF